MIPQKPKPPRNKELHKALMAKKGGAHKDRRPLIAKRAKALQEFRRELREYDTA